MKNLPAQLLIFGPGAAAIVLWCVILSSGCKPEDLSGVTKPGGPAAPEAERSRGMTRHSGLAR
jgi:hypothetical protein